MFPTFTQNLLLEVRRSVETNRHICLWQPFLFRVVQKLLLGSEREANKEVKVHCTTRVCVFPKVLIPEVSLTPLTNQ